MKRTEARCLVMIVVSLSLLIGATGCSDSTDPVPQPEPRAEVTFQTESLVTSFLGVPFKGAIAHVANIGDADAYYPIGCGYTVTFTVTNDQGELLLMRNPTLVPVCPPGFFTLAPGELIDASVLLTSAWNDDGTSYDIPPGQYTIGAYFRYYLGEDEDPIDLSQVVTVVLEP